ncbi:MAG: PAS domain-containing protein [Chthoniobacter sp.]|nr:PAS domain-containing protein [Chthoniobacter sp.]
MSWFFGILAAGIAIAWWLQQRRAEPHWRRLTALLDDLAAGRKPESFVFLDGGRFSALTHPLGKLAEEQERLRGQFDREEFNLRTILASMEEGVMVVDAQHVLRLVNPSFVRIFEPKGEPLGQTVLQLLREPEIEAMIAAAFETGAPQSRDVAINGGRRARQLGVHAVPIRDQANGPGVVAIVRDISRLKQLEDVRREFVANVSHELRTPLSIFHGYLENLQDDPGMARADQAEVFAILVRHSRRLNALLEDLLTLARLEARQETLRREVIAPDAFLRAVATDWESQLRKKKLHFTCEVPAGLPPLFGDPLRLGQVLNNLLENAVKYTGPGGEIRLRAAVTGGQFELRVEDTGPGIPPADLAHIFERFYRADKARTREQGGTGLGLSIVKHIVQTHGGTVLAESEYGKGTTIIVRLPLHA